MKLINTSVLLALGLSFIFFLSSCGRAEDLSDKEIEKNGGEGQILLEEDGILYENPAFGIALTFPEEWDGLYSLKEQKEYIIARTESNGILFDLGRTAGDLFDDAEDLGVENAEILFSHSGYTYYVTYPKDPQWDTEEEREIYEKLEEGIPRVLKSAKPLETDRPKAREEGYALVATPYFEAAIPDNWTLAKSEKTFQWNILTSEENVIGWFRLIPYDNGKSGEQTSERDGREAWVAWRSDDKRARTMEFAFFVRENSRNLGLSIIDTLKFKDGKENSIDVLSTANQYRSDGAVSVCGQIVSIEEQAGDTYLLTTAIPAEPSDAETETQFAAYILEDPVITDGTANAPGKVLQIDEFIKSFTSGNYDDLLFSFIIHNDMIQVITGYEIP